MSKRDPAPRSADSSRASRAKRARRVIVFWLVVAVCRSAVASEPAEATGATVIRVRHDLIRHFGAGVVSGLSGVASAAMAMAVLPAEYLEFSTVRNALFVSGVGAGVIAGSVKELVDALGAGVPDFLDLLFTAGGAAFGAGLAVYAAWMFLDIGSAGTAPASYANLAVVTAGSATLLFVGLFR